MRLQPGFFMPLNFGYKVIEGTPSDRMSSIEEIEPGEDWSEHYQNVYFPMPGKKRGTYENRVALNTDEYQKLLSEFDQIYNDTSSH